uniref:Uncharacterized protein n=1 Tax=Anguilla anguilla TaxID=7936 RepID=A0A0E9Q8Q3_ANGAN
MTAFIANKRRRTARGRSGKDSTSAQSNPTGFLPRRYPAGTGEKELAILRIFKLFIILWKGYS